MITLEQQHKMNNNKTPMEVLIRICDDLNIDQRGGGPEGLYYTHPSIEGEYLLRNLAILIKKAAILTRWE